MGKFIFYELNEVPKRLFNFYVRISSVQFWKTAVNRCKI